MSRISIYTFAILFIISKSTIAQPVISSFVPVSGPVNSSVTISGSNFSTSTLDNIVFFGAVKATVITASSNSLTVSVPPGATYEPITVSVSGRTAYSLKPFIVTYNCNNPLSGAFAAKIDSLTQNKPVSVAVADLDRDNKPDVVIVNELSGTLSVYKNNSLEGVISLKLSEIQFTSTTPRGLAIGDLDADGLPDIVVANNGAGSVSVFKNTSTGSAIYFATNVDYSAGTNPTSPVITDLNGDGMSDIIVTNSGSNTISVLSQIKNSLEGVYALKGYFVHTNPALTGPVVVQDGSIELRTYSSNQLAMYWQGLQAHPINNNGGLTYFSSQQPIYTINGITVTSVTNSFASPVYSIDNTYPNRYDIPTKTIYARYNYTGGTRIYTDTLTYMAPLPSATIIIFSKTDYSTGNTPSGVSSSDIDGDGKPDLIVSNSGDATVSVFKNTSSTGNTSFAARQNFTTGSSPKGVATADIDNDGKMDIVVANSNSNSISVLRNNSALGSPSFVAKVDFTTGTLPGQVSLGDLNGNGNIDIAVTNKTSNTISLFDNLSTPGNISIASKIDYTTGLSPEGLALADIDRDGKLDLISSNSSSNNISVLRSNFKEPVINSFLPLAGYSGDTITVKGINFTGVTKVNFNITPAASFNVLNDTTIAVVVGTGSNGIIKVSTGCGTGTKGGFIYSGTPSIISFSPSSGPVGTTVVISGSGFNTIAANNTVRFGNTLATVINATSTTLTVKVPPGATSKPISVSASQVTGYSANSFFVTSTGCNSPLSVTSFDTPKKFPIPGASWMMATGDLDGDGKTDIAYANYYSNTVSVYRNASAIDSIAFSPRLDYISGSKPDDAVIDDFDGDNKPDLIVVNNGEFLKNLSIFRNTSSPGSVSFAPTVSIPTGSGIIGDKLTVGDFDGDGKPDLIISWSDHASEHVLTILKNTSSLGNISFDQPVEFLSGFDGFVAVGDLDNDGRSDIALTNYFENTISVLRNTTTAGIISFAPRSFYAADNTPMGISIEDLDGDLKKDIAVVYLVDTVVSVYRNTSVGSNISLAPRVNLSLSVRSNYGVAIDDFDGDSKPDIAATSSTGVIVLKNNSTMGTLAFAPKIKYPLNPGCINISIADMDADGKADINVISGSQNNDSLSVLRNLLCEVISLCPNGSGTINAPFTGNSFQWQVNNGTGFVNLSDNINYSGTTSNQLQLLNMPSIFYSNKYRCIVDGITTRSYTIKFTNTWTGIVNSVWENPANWSCGVLPDAGTDVIISVGAAVINSNVTIMSLAISPTASLTVNTGFTLTITY